MKDCLYHTFDTFFYLSLFNNCFGQNSITHFKHGAAFRSSRHTRKHQRTRSAGMGLHMARHPTTQHRLESLRYRTVSPVGHPNQPNKPIWSHRAVRRKHYSAPAHCRIPTVRGMSCSLPVEAQLSTNLLAIRMAVQQTKRLSHLPSTYPDIPVGNSSKRNPIRSGLHRLRTLQTAQAI